MQGSTCASIFEPAALVPEAEARENARVASCALDLLGELRAAHLIIRNALNLMTPDQKLDWGRLNARDHVDGEGVTRANERAAVIARTGA